MKKVVVLTSHPIQYQAPLFRLLAKETNLDFLVWFCWNRGTTDKEFGVSVQWDIPLLRGYHHVFLKNYSLVPSSGFWGQCNPGVISKIIRVHPNLLILFGWNSFTNWMAFATAKILNIPVAVRGESPLKQEFLKKRWKIFLKKLLLPAFFSAMSAIFYIGTENRKFYEYYGVPHEKLFFTPYAVDNTFFGQKAKELKHRRKELRAMLGFGETDCILLFIGKLIPKKNPSDLLNAYKKLAPKNSNLKLIFVGDGSLREALEKSAAGFHSVKFVGFKNQTEVPAFYSLADILTLPSGLGETWGLVVNEAMCFGLPIIASDVIGCGSDLIREGVNGFIFPAGDVQKLTEAISFFLTHPEKQESFSGKSMEIIRRYSLDECVIGIQAGLRSLSRGN
ncbi:MAG: glycosyltransferase family 4 protein [Patescibacteria group bacterium]